MNLDVTTSYPFSPDNAPAVWTASHLLVERDYNLHVWRDSSLLAPYNANHPQIVLALPSTLPLTCQTWLINQRGKLLLILWIYLFIWQTGVIQVHHPLQFSKAKLSPYQSLR